MNDRSFDAGVVKPSRFSYLAPQSTHELTAALSKHGEDAKVLAGGQSLGPLLNFRLSTPSVIIDINRVADLDEIRQETDRLVIRATARQRDVERSADVAMLCPLMARALPHVAHRTIRNRGTVVGSLAHADPAAEMPAVAVALDAKIEVTGPTGVKLIPAAEFFRGYFTTVLDADEFASAVIIPAARPGERFAWLEFAPRDGDFAIVGVAVCLSLDATNAVSSLRLVYSGVADVPTRLAEVETLLLGRPITADALASVGEAAAAGIEPTSDLIASTAYRQHLVSVLTQRGIRAALESAA